MARERAYVDWKTLGICPYYMVGGDTRCYAGGRCRFHHPPPHEIGPLWERHAAKVPARDQGGDGPSTTPPPFGRGAPAYGLAVAPSPSAPWGEQLGAWGRAPLPPDHPVSRPRGLSERDDVPQVPARQQTDFPERRGRDTGSEDITRAAATIGAVEMGTPARATAVDAPSLPGTEAHGGIRQEPGTDNMTGATSAGLFTTPSLTNTNLEPLGRPNRLLQRADSHENSPLLSQGMPTAGARTVWKRDDTANAQEAPDENKEQVGEAKGGYWERLKATQADQNEQSNAIVGKEVKSKVGTTPHGDPQAGGNPASEPKPDPRLEGHVKFKLPALPAKRAPLPVPAALTSQPPAKAPESTMGATKRLSNGDPKAPIGPHPSTIRVAAPYCSQRSIDKRLLPEGVDHQERSLAEAREDSNRLQGVTWLDNVRRALQLPIRTYSTACVLYHKFRLAHPGADYAWADVTAACVLASCKLEDTLKKSRDILAVAYNLKAGSHEALGADDVVFEAPSRAVIGLERLVLEAVGFDFRSRDKHRVLVKIEKSLPASSERKTVGMTAWTVLTDLHRTFAPLKQTSATQAIASLELAGYLQAATSSTGTSVVKDQMQAFDMTKWHTTREEVMETLLDALDLYTHHTTASILGTKYSLDDFLRIRLALNKECSEKNIARYTTPPEKADRPAAAANGVTLQVANGHPTPVSPPQPGAQAQAQPSVIGIPPVPEGGGTLRFMLNPQLAADEKSEVQKYFVEEWEEYEEEIEIPLPRPKSIDRERERDRSERAADTRAPLPPASARARGDLDRRSSLEDRDRSDSRRDRGAREDRRPIDELRERDRERERDRLRERDREIERERVRTRERERNGRYDDRRYDERDRFERRDRDRRYDDYDRRRERR